MIAAPFEFGAVHEILTPPVAASMVVVTAFIYRGAAAARIEVIGEKGPSPHKFAARTLN